MRVLGSIGRKIGKLARENPEAVLAASVVFKACSTFEEYITAKVVQKMGREKEFVIRRRNLSAVFETAREELAVLYTKKCNELCLSGKSA